MVSRDEDHPLPEEVKHTPALTFPSDFMIKKILLALLALIVVFVIVVTLQPAEFSIARSTTIAAPPAAVFPHVNDLHQWEKWSPWEKIDPTMKRTFEGPATGTGSSYIWAGNDEIGEGRMTITESRPDEHVRIKLEFLKPFVATNDVIFSFKLDGSQTLVTWQMSGRNNWFFKAINLVMNMDKMCGDQFEQGLAQLKSITETKVQ